MKFSKKLADQVALFDSADSQVRRDAIGEVARLHQQGKQRAVDLSWELQTAKENRREELADELLDLLPGAEGMIRLYAKQEEAWDEVPEGIELPERRPPTPDDPWIGMYYIGAAKAAERVLSLCRDADPGVRQTAARALDILGVSAESSVPLLLELCGDESPDVRAAAQSALEKAGTPLDLVVAEVAPLLAHASFEVRLEAARLLAVVEGDTARTRIALTDIIPDGPERALAREALSLLMPGARLAVSQLLEVLAQGADERLIKAVASALRQFGEETSELVSALLECRLAGDSRGVEGAIQKIRRAVDSVGSVAQCSEMLRSGDDQERERAAEELSRLGDSMNQLSYATQDRLHSELLSGRERTELSPVRNAVNSLSRHQHALTEALRHGLKDRSAAVRRTAVQGMGKTLCAADVSVLVAHQRHLEVCLGFGTVEEGPSDLEEALEEFHQAVYRPAGPSEVLDALTAAAADIDESVRAAVAESLGRIGPAVGKPAIAALTRLMADPVEHVRVQAARALGTPSWTARPTTDPLVAALGDPSPKVRAASATALEQARVRVRRAIEPLVRLLADEPEVALAAAMALARMDPQNRAPIPLLSAALWHSDADKALGAAIALARVEPFGTELLEVLLVGIKRAKGERMAAAIDALRRFGPDAKDAVPELVRILHEEKDYRIRDLASRAIRLIGHLPEEGGAELAEEIVMFPMGGRLAPGQASGLKGVAERLRQGTLQEKRAALMTIEHAPEISAGLLPDVLAALADEQLRHDAVNALFGMEGAEEALGPLMTGRTAEDGKCPPLADLYLLRARLRKYSDRSTESLADYSEALRLNPSDTRVLISRGRLYTALHQYENALADFGEILRFAPASGCSTDRFEALMYRAEAYRLKGDLELALADLDAAGKDAMVGTLNNSRGMVLRQMKQFDKAIAEHTKAICMEPNEPYGYHCRGVAYMQAGRYREAIFDFRQSLRYDPSVFTDQCNLSWILATCPDDACRDGTAAVEHAMRACEATGWQNPGVLDTLAAAYAEKGEFEKAISWQERALADAEYKKEEGDEARKRLALYRAGRPYRTTGS